MALDIDDQLNLMLNTWRGSSALAKVSSKSNKAQGGFSLELNYISYPKAGFKYLQARILALLLLSSYYSTY